MNTYKCHRFPPDIFSYKSIRLWCNKFGPKYARRLKRKYQGYGDTFIIDEVFVKINGKQHYLWRAVDQDGEPRKVVTDKLASYRLAQREIIPESIHVTGQYANNRAEQSHESTSVRERGIRKFKSVGPAQKFLSAHAAVCNLFNLGRHLVSAHHYRNLRISAFNEWGRAGQGS
jgi:putative transposase